MRSLFLLFGFMLINIDYAAATLPQRVKLTKDMVFIIPAAVGNPEVLVQAGTDVKLIKVVGEKLHLGHGVAETMVSPDYTDVDKKLISEWKESEASRLALALSLEAKRKAAADELEKKGITLLMGKVFQSVGAGLIVTNGNGAFVLLRGAPFQPEGSDVECFARDTRQMYTYSALNEAERSIPVFNWVPSAD